MITRDSELIFRIFIVVRIIIILFYSPDSSYIGNTNKPSNSAEGSVMTNFPTQLDGNNGKSPISSEITPQVRMDPPNCSSTPFRTPRSVKRGRRSKPLFGSPALPYQSTEDRILGM